MQINRLSAPIRARQFWPLPLLSLPLGLAHRVALKI
jgi:hypothetical protein